MNAFFYGIQTLFVDYLFWPLDALRALELKNWFAANLINWIFMIICAVALVYWSLQLKVHQKNNEENQDTTAHSFLK